MTNYARPSPETVRTVILWALGKLEEELTMYIDLDMIKKGAVSDGLEKERNDVRCVHRKILNNELIIQKVKKETKNAKAARRDPRRAPYPDSR